MSNTCVEYTCSCNCAILQTRTQGLQPFGSQHEQARALACHHGSCTLAGHADTGSSAMPPSPLVRHVHGWEGGEMIGVSACRRPRAGPWQAHQACPRTHPWRCMHSHSQLHAQQDTGVAGGLAPCVAVMAPLVSGVHAPWPPRRFIQHAACTHACACHTRAREVIPEV